MGNEVSVDPRLARQFAEDVVARLQQAGFQAFWAGGCVRDELLGRAPADYDVATNATPEQVRQLFGRRRTIPVGAAFGVITVLGPTGAGQVEVATFRQEEGYSDGRHPDRVRFSSPEQDALRRDFTINGLFYDPIHDKVIDYVGGRDDLAAGLIRAIGNPNERIGEDKLRMLRAVRFATTLSGEGRTFRIEPATLRAIRTHADEIDQVSAERIGMEMRKLLEHANRAVGLGLLRESGLWHKVLPEFAALKEPDRIKRWQQALTLCSRLGAARLSVALAALLWPLAENMSAPKIAAMVRAIRERWRLTNQEAAETAWILRNLPVFLQADKLRWSQVQPRLVSPYANHALGLAEAIAQETGARGPAYCREKQKLPPAVLDPLRLVTGDDLQSAGIPAGPLLGRLLREIRAAQLDGQLQTKTEAIAFAQRRWQELTAQA